MQRKSMAPLIRRLKIFLGFSCLMATAANSQGGDGGDRIRAVADFWRLPHLQGKIDPDSADSQWKNPYFWEVSYYQFYNSAKQIGGNISVFVLSPRFNPKLTVIGSIHRLGRQTEFFRQFPLSETWMDPTSADILAQEGQDRIEILNNGSRLRFSVQEVSADLQVDAPLAKDWLTPYQFPQTADLSRISPSRLFDYRLTWLPVSPQASYSGNLQFGPLSTKFELGATPGYHDRLWGVWNPGAQPYQWISFLARSQSGEKIEGLVGYFPGLNDFGGAWLRDDDRTYFCEPSKIKTDVKETTAILPTRFDPFQKVQVFHRDPPQHDPRIGEMPIGSTQNLPKQLTLTLSECRAPGSDTVMTGIFDINAHRFDAKGLDLPANLGSLLFNDFSIADMDATLTGFLSRNAPGTPRRMNTLQGNASLQAISGEQE